MNQDLGNEELNQLYPFLSNTPNGIPAETQTLYDSVISKAINSNQNQTHPTQHQIYPQAIRWFAEERLSIQEQQVLLDGAPITAEFTG